MRKLIEKIKAFLQKIFGGKSKSTSTGVSGGEVPSTAVFKFKQTKQDCPGCGWMWTKSLLRITHSKGKVTTVNGEGFIVKKNPPRNPTVEFLIPDVVNNVTKAELILTWHVHEGLANGDNGSVVEVRGNGKLIHTLNAVKGKVNGSHKAGPPLKLDMTSIFQ